MTFYFSQRILVNLESRMATCSHRAVQKSAMEQVANECRTEKRKKFLFIYDACGHLKTRLWFYGAPGSGLEGFLYLFDVVNVFTKKASNYLGSSFYKRLFNHQKLKKQLNFIGDGLFGD